MNMGIWQELQLTLRFTTPLCGGVPRCDDTVKNWIAHRSATDAAHAKMQSSPPGPDGVLPRTLGEIAEEALATIDPPTNPEDEMNKVWVGFHRDDAGLFVRGANLRAHLKDCADVIARLLKNGHVEGFKELKQFRAKIVDALYIKEERMRLFADDGSPAQQATGSRDATMQVMTTQGPRTCLKRIDFIFPVTIHATLQFLAGGEVNRDHLILLLEYGKVHGFNQDRSLQFGRYEYELGD
jgi:hypothetical protein